MTTEQDVVLSERYLTRLATLSLTGASLLARMWDDLGSYDEADIEAFTEQAEPALNGLGQASAALTAGYVSLLTGERIPAPTLRLAQDMRHPFIGVWKELQDGVSYEVAVQNGRERAASLARERVMLGQAETAQQATRVTGWRRVPKGSTCSYCVLVSTQRYKSFESARRVGHRNKGRMTCVLGSTFVSSSLSVAGTRQRYDGEIVVLRTAAGNDLAVTTDHPVLTLQGWVDAGCLREGMYVLRSGPADRVLGGVPDEYEMPTRIEEIFRAACVSFGGALPAATQYFNGDIGAGKVDVVPTNRELWNRTFPYFHQQSVGASFAISHELALSGSRLCPRHHVRFERRSSPRSVMGSGSLSGALRSGHLVGAVAAGLTSSAGSDPGGHDDSPNGSPRESELLSQGVLREPSEVQVDDFTGWVAPSLSPWYRQSVQPVNERVGTDPDGAARLLKRLPRQVEPDRIVQLYRINGTHDVYNLQTTSGWFVANGIITHNCDCSVVPIIGNRDPGRVINRPVLDAWKQAQRDDTPRYFDADALVAEA